MYKKQVIVVSNVKIGRKVVSIKFIHKGHRVIAILDKDHRIVIHLNNGEDQKRYPFEAFEPKNSDIYYWTGRTPAKAFAKAARFLWK